MSGVNVDPTPPGPPSAFCNTLGGPEKLPPVSWVTSKNGSRIETALVFVNVAIILNSDPVQHDVVALVIVIRWFTIGTAATACAEDAVQRLELADIRRSRIVVEPSGSNNGNAFTDRDA